MTRSLYKVGVVGTLLLHAMCSSAADTSDVCTHFSKQVAQSERSTASPSFAVVGKARPCFETTERCA